MKILKFAAAAVLIALIFCFCSCTKESIVDYSGLCLRMSRVDKRFSLPDNGVFYSNGVYYIYYSLCADSDVLLTARENEDKQLERVVITLLNEDKSNSLSAYRSICFAAAEAYVPCENTAALAEQTGIADDSFLFFEAMRSATFENYTLSAVSSEAAVSFIMERSEK